MPAVGGTDVTVHFTCSDALSNIHDCAADQTFTEGAVQTATGTATDNAGNTSSATVSSLNVDETPPTVTGNSTVAANANGWYNNDVVVHWSCADALSGVGSCPADSTVTGEGSDLGATSGDAYGQSRQRWLGKHRRNPHRPPGAAHGRERRAEFLGEQRRYSHAQRNR